MSGETKQASAEGFTYCATDATNFAIVCPSMERLRYMWNLITGTTLDEKKVQQVQITARK